MVRSITQASKTRSNVGRAVDTVRSDEVSIQVVRQPAEQPAAESVGL